jgi:hypothetical protein
VIEPTTGFRLPLETLDPLGIGSTVAPEELERHSTFDRELLRLPHHPHPATAQFADQTELADHIPGLEPGVLPPTPGSTGHCRHSLLARGVR